MLSDVKKDLNDNHNANYNHLSEFQIVDKNEEKKLSDFERG
jgi:hypothetical protein